MEVLVPAIKLLSHAGVEIAEDLTSITYWHLLLDKHEVIFAEGMPTESLFTGPEALKSVSPEAKQEIKTLFPELSAPGFTAEPARFILQKGGAIQQLVARHAKHSRFML